MFKTLDCGDFGTARYLEYEGQKLFVAIDIGVLIGYSKNGIRSNVTRVPDGYKVNIKDITVDVTFTGVGSAWVNEKGVTLLSMEGVQALLEKTKLLSPEKKKQLWGVLNGTIQPPRQPEFIKELKDSLKPFNLDSEELFECCGHMIQFYIPNLKIAVDYIEDGNDFDSFIKSVELENIHGITAITCLKENSNAYNIGLVMKEVCKKLGGCIHNE